MVTAILILTLTMMMFPLAVFAADGDTAPERNGEKAKRTILLYACGADLETEAAMATYNLRQILASRFSSDDDINFLIMTGGSHEWQIDKEYLDFSDVKVPDDAVVEYDQYEPERSETLDPKSQVSNVYNQIWEAKGLDADTGAGKMVLIDGDGITKDDEAVKSKDELMSDPDTLKAFIDYGVNNYPAEKYDLILWDHGGGPEGGYGVDEHYYESEAEGAQEIMSFAGIVDALSDNAVTKNDADGDGKKDKFDFIDFDACLMNSIELALAISDYTDYYIASAETEPGYGQYYGPRAENDGKQYKGWLDELGDPKNDAKYDAPDGTYELGKVIVDDFYNFYEKETGDGHSQEGTLAVIDTEKMIKGHFIDTMTAMVRQLTDEAAAPDEECIQFYDELKSYYNSIEYSEYELFDLGQVASLLSVVNSELSEADLDREDDYYINCNNYGGFSRELLKMLYGGSEESFMYARGTSGIMSKEQYYSTKDGSLGYGALAPSGMSIYFPGRFYTFSAPDYMDSIDPVIDKMPDGDKRKTFLKAYEQTVSYYDLILYTGKIIDSLLNDEGDDFDIKSKSDVDLDMFMKFFKDEQLGVWKELAIPAISKIQGVPKEEVDEHYLDDWFKVLVSQQVEDAVYAKEVTIEKQGEDENDACRVIVKNARKRIVESVERSIVAELPAMEDYIRTLRPTDQSIIQSAGGLSLGTVEGRMTSAPEGSSIADMIRWYKSTGGEWDIDALENKWFAVSDAQNGIHAVSIFSNDEDGIVIPAVRGTSADGPETDRFMFVEFACEKKDDDSYPLTAVWFIDQEAGPVRVEPEQLTGEIAVTPVMWIRTFVGDYLPPVSKNSFTVSADNADNISIKYMDISEIEDIADVDGDGKALDSNITIRDLYGRSIAVTDRIHIKNVKIKPAVYTGKDLAPEAVVTYEGDTLRSGVDYILDPGLTEDPKTEEYYTCKIIKPGTYEVRLVGKSRFYGTCYMTFQVTKKANTMKIKAKNAMVRYSKLKKKSQKLKVAKVIKFIDKGQGTRSYKKISGSKKITVNKKNGKVTVKKGLKKGRYKVRIKVTAKGNSTTKSITKTVTYKVVVK
ncbi:MAG: hypothetical protein IKF07_04825 [Eubacterium sp.]|nr:hypothetical protein [Eubacterium sp.]